jgi:type IV pilus assembly protein PilY1
MKRIFSKLIDEVKAAGLGLILIAGVSGLTVHPAQADWQTPIMSDYVKSPVFISNSAKPNILIALDNSGSMNSLAYPDGYTGTPYNGTTVSFPVLLERDDMEESMSGEMRDGSGSGNDLDFGTDYLAVRFQGVSLPQGATIVSARIDFAAKNNFASVVSNLVVKGETSDDAPFLDVNTPYNISSRPVTSAFAAWTPGDWVAGTRYSTPDLTAIVQEIVNRPNWQAGKAMLFRIDGSGFPGVTTGHREAQSRESGQAVGPMLYITYIDQVAGTRYYGYFNPDYFYSYSSNVFWPKYKKVSYVPASNSWNVKTLAGASATLDDSVISPAVKSNGLWDGNWMNWMSMRRVDVLRKVLMGGKATSRTGGGNQQNQCESAASGYGTFSKTFSSASGPATTPYKGSYTYGVTEGGYLNVSSTNHKLDIQKYKNIDSLDYFEGNLAGVLQRIGSRARWGNMWFNGGTGTNQSGGFVQNPIDNDFGTNFLPGLQNQKCDTWTPLAEALYVATQYFAQEPVATGLDYPSQSQLFGIGKDTLKDPYWDKAKKRSIPCANSFVLLLTDGASTKDAKIPVELKDFDKDGKDKTSCNESTGDNCNYPSGGTDFLDDVALYGRTTDLRPDLADNQNVLLYTVYAFDKDPNGRSLLMDAARNGGFEDLNNDGKPNGTYTDPANLRAEWDADGDGIPDTYYEANDGYELERQLLAAIESILKRASSGTAASVVSNSRSGEGAVYQSIFYPAETVNGNTIKWVGQVHALLADAHGNMREDTNKNQQLDLDEDLFIVFGETTVQRYRDADHNGIFDENDEGPVADADKRTEFKFSELNYLWSSSGWLNSLKDATNQRPYASTAPQRHIITFADRNGDMVADSNEVKDFTALTDPSWSVVSDPGDFLAYIHPYKPFSPPIDPTASNFEAMVSRLTRRVINFTRGQDQDPDAIGSLELPAFRNREYMNTKGEIETWRLGDIVYSTPTVVGAPAENFDLLYNDLGYSAFYKKYQYRRNMVYVGANDGMLHAFNSGFFNATQNQFALIPYNNLGEKVTDGGPYTEFELGAELWAYVPFNLLPHLYWRTQTDYEHVFYMDLPPRIFDARIYPHKGPNDATNPNGWATVMVAGMNFGGGKIAADIDKKDGAYNPAVDKAMSSAFAIFDITNPEEPPKLLGEISFPELGFTTCHPGVIAVRDLDENRKETTNQWYLLFGSGPISKDAASADGANYSALIDGTSTQQAVMYAVDLVDLASKGKVVTLTDSGPKTYAAANASDPHYLVRFPEAQSSISKPITVDWDLNFNADAAYFGISFGNHTTGWSGKMRRIVIENGSDPKNPKNWTLDSTLLNLTKGSSTNLDNGQPIMAHAMGGVDKAGNHWLFFGTGRFYAQADKLNTDQQTYYGVKEPFTTVNGIKKFTHAQVPFNALLETTSIKVYENGDTVTGFSDFQALVNKIEDSHSGWRMEFTYKTGERNLGEAVLAGDVLTFTTYIPTDDPCGIDGESMVYALYYRTGTAYAQSVIGLNTSDVVNGNALVLKNTSLGQGMTITPNIHVGREEGTRAYIQTSTGAIKPLDQANPGVIKSGKIPVQPGLLVPCP